MLTLLLALKKNLSLHRKKIVNLQVSKRLRESQSNYYEFQMFVDLVAEQAQTERDKAETADTVGQFQFHCEF